MSGARVLDALPDDDEGTPAGGPVVYDARGLLELAIPPREYLLEKLLREKETAMVHAWRGVGKTHAGLELAYAVASGGIFLRWSAPEPRRVLYLDGEMPGRTMQERMAAILRASPQANTFDPGFLRFVCADLQDTGIPNLSTPAGQDFIEPLLEDMSLVVIDSISTLARYGRENDTESGTPLQEWALRLRRQGLSVLLLHHDNKAGGQRGASGREDILDLVLGLRRPSDYEPNQGARFEVHFEKARGLIGPDVEAFEAALVVTPEGGATWTMRNLEDTRLQRAATMLRDGAKVVDVQAELGVSRATAYRYQATAREKGLLR